jgi:hypothetical protein
MTTIETWLESHWIYCEPIAASLLRLSRYFRKQERLPHKITLTRMFTEDANQFLWDIEVDWAPERVDCKE